MKFFVIAGEASGDMHGANLDGPFLRLIQRQSLRVLEVSD